mgnify:CR=1 FL=1
MKFNSALKNFVLVLFSTLLISACSTAKKASVDTVDDVYTGTDTVEYLANGVPCLLYTSPSPRDKRQYRMPSSA